LNHSKLGSKIVLIDGSRSAELMIEFGVAVATDATYTAKRIDNDFFEAVLPVRDPLEWIERDWARQG
jgi:restriction endonuclease Mrr